MAPAAGTISRAAPGGRVAASPKPSSSPSGASPPPEPKTVPPPQGFPDSGFLALTFDASTTTPQSITNVAKTFNIFPEFPSPLPVPVTEPPAAPGPAPCLCQTSTASGTTYSVQTWIRWTQRTDLSPDININILSCDGFWSIGLKGDGRVYATFTLVFPVPPTPEGQIPPTRNFPTCLFRATCTTVSDGPLSSDDWHLITFSVASDGTFILYDGATQLNTSTASAPWTSRALFQAPAPSDEVLPLDKVLKLLPPGIELAFKILKADLNYATEFKIGSAANLSTNTTFFGGQVYNAIFFDSVIDTKNLSSRIDNTIYDELPENATGAMYVACVNKALDAYFLTRPSDIAPLVPTTPLVSDASPLASSTNAPAGDTSDNATPASNTGVFGKHTAARSNIPRSNSPSKGSKAAGSTPSSPTKTNSSTGTNAASTSKFVSSSPTAPDTDTDPNDSTAVATIAANSDTPPPGTPADEHPGNGISVPDANINSGNTDPPTLHPNADATSSNSGDKPEIKNAVSPPIPIPAGFSTPSIQSCASARSMSSGGYIECDTPAPFKNCCLEGWIKPFIASNDDEQWWDFTIASYGFRLGSEDADLEHSEGWRLYLAIRKHNDEKARDIFKCNLVLERYPDPHNHLTYAFRSMIIPGEVILKDLCLWSHIALNIEEDKIEVFYNGQLLPSEFVGGLDGEHQSLRQSYFNHPIILGAVFTGRSFPGIEGPGQRMTDFCFEGYLRNFRFWKHSLFPDDISDIFSLKFTAGSDFADMNFFVDLGVQNSSDITQSTVVQCFGQTSPCTSINGTVSADDRLDQDYQNEKSRIGTAASQNSALENDLSGKLVLRPDLVAPATLYIGVLVSIVKRLSNRSYNQEPLAELVALIFRGNGTELQPYIDSLVNATGDNVLSATLDLVYVSMRCGFLDGVLSCFQLSRFGISYLVTLFKPEVHRTQLKNDLSSVKDDIEKAINTYSTTELHPLSIVLTAEESTDKNAPSEKQPSEKQPSEKQPSEKQPSEKQPTEKQPPEKQPLENPAAKNSSAETLPAEISASLYPLTDRIQISLKGPAIQAQIKPNQTLGEDDQMIIELESKPAGYLDIKPNKLTLDGTNSKEGVAVSITCREYPVEGRVSLMAKREWFHDRLIEFDVSTGTALEARDQAIIIPDLNSAFPEEHKFSLNLKATGPSTLRLPLLRGVAWADDGSIENILLTQPGKGDLTGVKQPKNFQTKGHILFGSDEDNLKQRLTILDNYGNIVDVPICGASTSQEVVDVYMANAGSGDAFYMHFLKNNREVRGTGPGKEAVFVIDGGSDAAYAESMWGEVDKQHLPKNNTVDLMILSDRDEDHTKGFLWMCEQMDMGPITRKDKSPLGSQRLRGLKPSVVWIESQDPNIAKIPGSAAEEIEKLCTKNKWDTKKTPLPLSQQGPKTASNAGALWRYDGPSPDLFRSPLVASTNVDGFDKISIISEMTGVDFPSWHSLWPGDAWDTPEEPDIRTALGLVSPRADAQPERSRILKYKKYGKGQLPGEAHYLILKVGNHGSETRNSLEFFQAVTADHYLISGNEIGMPSQNCLQWILDGHHQKWIRETQKGYPMSPCTIWINNAPVQPVSSVTTETAINLDAWSNIVYKHPLQRILYRNGPSDAKSGHLYFQIVDGVLRVMPKILPNYSAEPKDSTTVTLLKGSVKQIGQVLSIDNPYWKPLYLPKDFNATDTDIFNQCSTEMQENLTRMYNAGVTCDKLHSFTGDPGEMTGSDLTHVLKSPAVIPPPAIYYEHGPQDENDSPSYPFPWLRWISITGPREGAPEDSSRMLALVDKDGKAEDIVSISVYASKSQQTSEYPLPSRFVFTSTSGTKFSTKMDSPKDDILPDSGHASKTNSINGDSDDSFSEGMVFREPDGTLVSRSRGALNTPGEVNGKVENQHEADEFDIKLIDFVAPEDHVFVGFQWEMLDETGIDQLGCIWRRHQGVGPRL